MMGEMKVTQGTMRQLRPLPQLEVTFTPPEPYQPRRSKTTVLACSRERLCGLNQTWKEVRLLLEVPLKAEGNRKRQQGFSLLRPSNPRTFHWSNRQSNRRLGTRHTAFPKSRTAQEGPGEDTEETGG